MSDNLERLMTTMRSQAVALAQMRERDQQRARWWGRVAAGLFAVSAAAVGLTVPAWVLCREEVATLERQAAPEVLGTVVPAQRYGRPQALQMPPKPRREWVPAEEGCPPGYRPINGACWVEVVEPLPCRTSYQHAGKCWAPLGKGERPGVSAPGAIP